MSQNIILRLMEAAKGHAVSPALAGLLSCELHLLLTQVALVQHKQ